jgi:hypothetical protein
LLFLFPPSLPTVRAGASSDVTSTTLGTDELDRLDPADLGDALRRVPSKSCGLLG